MSDKLLTWEKAVEWLREQPDQKELVRYCYYDDPIENAAERFSNSQEWEAVFQLLNKHIPGKVLDLGAGRGISSYAFARVQCAVTALEPDPSPLVGAGCIQSLINATGVDIKIVRKHGEALPFPDNCFDIVYGRAVFHHADDLPSFCKEAARVLKKGGCFLATREHVISKKSDLQQFLDSHPLHYLYKGENAFLLQEYTNAIHAAGLVIHETKGPFSSPINYAPMTEKEHQKWVADRWGKLVGKPLADKLSTSTWFKNITSKIFDRLNNNPGRLYTFFAVKEE